MDTRTADYKKRFVAEYNELLERTNKLELMLRKQKAGLLDFEPDCPLSLLNHQLGVMLQYLDVLKDRAVHEGVELKY